MIKKLAAAAEYVPAMRIEPHGIGNLLLIEIKIRIVRHFLDDISARKSEIRHHERAAQRLLRRTIQHFPLATQIAIGEKRPDAADGRIHVFRQLIGRNVRRRAGRQERLIRFARRQLFDHQLIPARHEAHMAVGHQRVFLAVPELLRLVPRPAHAFGLAPIHRQHAHLVGARRHLEAMLVLLRIELPADADMDALRMRRFLEQILHRPLAFRIAVAAMLTKIDARFLMEIPPSSSPRKRGEWLATPPPLAGREGGGMNS